MTAVAIVSPTRPVAIKTVSAVLGSGEVERACTVETFTRFSSKARSGDVRHDLSHVVRSSDKAERAFSTIGETDPTGSIRPLPGGRRVDGSKRKSDAATSTIKGAITKPLSDGVMPGDAKEAELTGEIAKLWTNQLGKGSSLRRSRLELAAIREKLGEHLSEYKRLLAKTGRDGKWMAFLREAQIPKASAERYVAKWKISQLPKETNRTSGTILAPTADEIDEIVKKLKARMQRVLTTPESVALFLRTLTAAFQPPLPIP
jgi:hypothetical protein